MNRPNTHISEDRAGAVLTIDLNAIVDNWRSLNERVGDPCECAAVVKADAYGLGMHRVAPKLWEAGAYTFFVAQIGEGIELRELLPGAEIHILSGCFAGTEMDCLQYGLIPVLNSLEDIKRWGTLAKKLGQKLKVTLQVDTAMTRLGLSPKELATVAQEPDLLDGFDVQVVMSHLACADEADHPQNKQQLDAFIAARKILPQGRASFCNSAGIFLANFSHFDLVRPGCALYGVNPTPDKPNPMAQVIQLSAKVLQVHEIDTPRCVGYGASHHLAAGQRVATLALGYADGYLRSLSGKAKAWINETEVNVIGRVSMDMIAIDVSHIDCRQGDLVEMIGPHISVDDIASAAGTIGYEILTSLGARYHRVYKG